MKFSVYDISCPPKPRQTRRNRYKKTPSDERYYYFKDETRRLGINVPESGYHVLFVRKMPESWTLKKKNEMRYDPHQQTPDKDNMEKAMLDAIFDKHSPEKNDSHVWDGRVSKVWGDEDKLIIVTGIDTGWIKDFLSEVLS